MGFCTAKRRLWSVPSDVVVVVEVRHGVIIQSNFDNSSHRYNVIRQTCCREIGDLHAPGRSVCAETKAPVPPVGNVKPLGT